MFVDGGFGGRLARSSRPSPVTKIVRKTMLRLLTRSNVAERNEARGRVALAENHKTTRIPKLRPGRLPALSAKRRHRSSEQIGGRSELTACDFASYEFVKLLRHQDVTEGTSISELPELFGDSVHQSVLHLAGEFSRPWPAELSNRKSEIIACVIFARLEAFSIKRQSVSHMGFDEIRIFAT